MSKQVKKILSMVLAVAMVLTSYGVVANYAQAKSAPKLSSKSISITVKKTKTIKVKNSKKKAKWSIKKGSKYISLSKKKKSSVVVKGKKVGSAVVQAKIGSKKLTCKVKVVKAKAKAAPVATPVVPAITTAPVVTPTPTPEVPKVTPGPTYAPTEFKYEGTDITGLDPEKPAVAFTFDDGPVGNKDTSNSMIIHKALKAHNAHASFFYIGGSVKAGPDAQDEVKQAKDNGFDVGNHSYGWGSVPSIERTIRTSIGDTNKLLTDITGYSKFLFRAPNLAYNQKMLGYINAPFIDCSVDSKDYVEGTTSAQIRTNVNAAKDGDIVLMHETEDNTAAIIDTILDDFDEKGIQVVSVTQLFALKNKPLMTGTIYQSVDRTKTIG